MESKKILNKTVCIVGLGYVGLPLAEDFSHHIRTIGYRRDQNKVDELNNIPGNRIEATTDPQTDTRGRFCYYCSTDSCH